MKLTQAEIDKAESCQTSDDWTRFCDEVQAARPSDSFRGGQYPSDWWEKMKLSGRMERITKRWGGSSGLTISIFDSFGKRKDL